MPQMSPINWLTLFLLFMMIIFMFINNNYFLFNYKKNKSLISLIYISTNWKW